MILSYTNQSAVNSNCNGVYRMRTYCGDKLEGSIVDGEIATSNIIFATVMIAFSTVLFEQNEASRSDNTNIANKGVQNTADGNPKE